MKKRKNKNDFRDFLIIILLIYIILLQIGLINSKTKNTNLETNSKITENKTEKIEFPYSGDQGSLMTEKGNYHVGLYTGDIKDTTKGQIIVDADYEAIVDEIEMLDDNKNPIDNSKLTVIMDHDSGIPAALPATSESEKMYIKTIKGKVKKYKKIATIETGERTTRDMLTESDHDVREKSFLEDFGDTSKIIMFITCKDKGRQITLWYEQ